MKVSLTVVIKKIKAGDWRYFSILVQEFTPIILPIAKYYLMSAYNQTDDIEDVLQETWTKVYRHINLLTEPEKFPGWITRIVKHECLNIQEKNKKFIKLHLLIDPETRDDLLNAFSEAEENLDEDAISSANIRSIVELLLKEIDDTYALPIKLFHLDEMTLKNIATMLGITENLVKTRLHRGRNMLRAKIREKTTRN